MSAIIPMVAADLTKRIAWAGVGIKRITAYNPNGAAVYIQLFQTPTVTAGDVPVAKSLLVPAGAQVAYEYTDDFWLSELLVALSTTEANYTAVGAGAGLDMNLVVDSDFLVSSTNTIVGTLVGVDVANLQVWAQASGPKKLLRADIKNNLGSTAYPYISAIDSPAAKNSAMIRLHGSTTGGIANGATQSFFFGKAGLSPIEISSTGVVRQGCTIVMSASGDINTTTLSGASFDIRAIYE